jgi:ankyrin repeat protein
MIVRNDIDGVVKWLDRHIAVHEDGLFADKVLISRDWPVWTSTTSLAEWSKVAPLALHCAAKGTDVMLNLLLMRYPLWTPLYRTDTGDTLLTLAVKRGNVDIFLKVYDRCKMLLHVPDDQQHTPLLLAVLYNRIEMFRFMTLHGADVTHLNREGQTVLMLAVKKRSTDICQLILSNLHTHILVATPRSSGTGAVAVTTATSSTRSAVGTKRKGCCDTGGYVDNSGEHPSGHPAGHSVGHPSGHSGTPRRAVELFNVQDARGYTALMYAVFSGWTWAIRQLLLANARHDLVNADGETALQIAQRLDYPDITRCLQNADGLQVRAAPSRGVWVSQRTLNRSSYRTSYLTSYRTSLCFTTYLTLLRVQHDTIPVEVSMSGGTRRFCVGLEMRTTAFIEHVCTLFPNEVITCLYRGQAVMIPEFTLRENLVLPNDRLVANVHRVILQPTFMDDPNTTTVYACRTAYDWDQEAYVPKPHSVHMAPFSSVASMDVDWRRMFRYGHRQPRASSYTLRLVNVSGLEYPRYYGPPFTVTTSDGTRWCALVVAPNERCPNMGLFVVAADGVYMPPGWQRRAVIKVTLYNQLDPKDKRVKHTDHLFRKGEMDWGWRNFVRSTELKSPELGWCVNDTICARFKITMSQ